MVVGFSLSGVSTPFGAYTGPSFFEIPTSVTAWACTLSQMHVTNTEDIPHSPVTTGEEFSSLLAQVHRVAGVSRPAEIPCLLGLFVWTLTQLLRC